MSGDRDPGQILHATTVGIDGRAAVIRGASGAGKSGLAVQMLALGAVLISDDRTEVRASGGEIWAQAPRGLPALIEMRGLGLARAALAGPMRVVLVVDLDLAGADRLPEPEETSIKQRCLPLIRGKNRPNLASELVVVLKAGFDRPFADPSASQ